MNVEIPLSSGNENGLSGRSIPWDLSKKNKKKMRKPTIAFEMLEKSKQ